MIAIRVPKKERGIAWRAMIEIAPIRLIADDPVYEVLPAHLELLDSQGVTYEIVRSRPDRSERRPGFAAVALTLGIMAMLSHPITFVLSGFAGSFNKWVFVALGILVVAHFLAVFFLSSTALILAVWCWRTAGRSMAMASAVLSIMSATLCVFECGLAIVFYQSLNGLGGL
jgi:hypothetical protein